MQYFNLAVFFLRFPVLYFLAVPISAVPGTAKYGGNFLAVMKYGCTFFAVPGISYFGGTDFGGSR